MADHLDIAEQLAQEVGGKVIRKKAYGRIVVGRKTCAYVNRTFLDFRTEDVAQAPKGTRAKLTIKGSRATLPLSETKAAAALLRHVAGATQ
jgi:hypothetical protein